MWRVTFPQQTYDVPDDQAGNPFDAVARALMLLLDDVSAGTIMPLCQLDDEHSADGSRKEV